MREGGATADARLPRLSSARAPLTRCVSAVNAWGETVPSTIPCERALTVYVDKREVVTLIARGKSNSEIADELVLSKRTVEKHIANILSKLAFMSRAQIVRWAMEQGLT